MRKLTLIGLAITAITALSAIAAGLANAALPEFLPTGTTARFTSFAGPGKLRLAGGATIECTSETDSGAITGAKTVTVTIDFLKCKAFGLAAHSLGDAGETILVTATGELCFIKKTAPLEVGLLLKPTGIVHLEIPSLSLLIVIPVGSVVGAITPINSLVLEFRLLFKEAAGRQSPTGCEGQTEELRGSVDEGAEEAATLVNHTVIGFLTSTVEIMG